MRSGLVGLLLLVVAPAFAAAHPILVAQESVFVQRDEVVLTMQIYAEDLQVYHDLRPNDLNVISKADLEDAAAQHADFLLGRLRVIDATGNRLEGRSTKVDHTAISEPGYKVPELLNLKLEYEFEYPLDEPPRFLTFAQDLGVPQAGFVAEIQLTVRQAGSPVEVIRALKTGEPITIPFDWEDVPPDAAATAEEREQWLAAQREKTLGIVDPNAAYARYYVSNRGVKLEFLIPFTALESLLDGFIDREKRSFLEVEEQEPAREQIADYLRDENPVKIDGVEVPPRIDRIDFYDVSARDFGLPAEGARISTVNSRVGIVLFYPAKEPPGNVEIVWSAFSRQLREVDTLFLTPDGVDEPIFSQPERADYYEWTSPGWPAIPPIEAVVAANYEPPLMTIPVVPLACLFIGVAAVGFWLAIGSRGFALGAALAAGTLGLGTWFALPSSAYVVVENPLESRPEISAEDATDVFRTLLANTYRAFDYTAEEDVYDSLARSIDGPLLRETYLRVNESLRMQDQGGAIAVVDEVKVLDGEKESLPGDDDVASPGFRYRVTWTVQGTVEHWGHLHSRTNRYTGLFTVRSRDDEWKITDLEVLDEERVGTRTGIR